MSNAGTDHIIKHTKIHRIALLSEHYNRKSSSTENHFSKYSKPASVIIKIAHALQCVNINDSYYISCDDHIFSKLQ